MTEPVEVYRLKLRRGTSSSYPDWKLYENKGEFDVALLEALIEEAAEYDNRSPFVRAAGFWKDLIYKRDKRDGSYRPVSKVVGAEKLVNGEWVELKPRLVPPRLEFDD